LYPNELRASKAQGVFFKPFMSLFGEMFKPETATYAFDSVDGCQSSDKIIPIPFDVINEASADFVYYTQDKKRTKTEIIDETHPFYNLTWYKPTHLISKNPNLTLHIVGLLSFDEFKQRVRVYEVVFRMPRKLDGVNVIFCIFGQKKRNF